MGSRNINMPNQKKRDAFYRLFFSKENKDFSLVDFLNDSTCDETVDIDLSKDTFRQVFHKEGKYFEFLHGYLDLFSVDLQSPGSYIEDYAI